MKRILIGLMILALCGLAQGLSLKAGDTSPRIQFRIVGSDELGVTGLTAADFSAYYCQDADSDDTVTTDGTNVAITLVDIEDGSADPNYYSGGIAEEGFGNYRLDPPLAAVAGNPHSHVSITIIYAGATPDIQVSGYYDLTPAVDAILINTTPPSSHDPTTDPIVLPTTPPSGWISEDALGGDAATEIAEAVSAVIGNITPPPAGTEIIRGTVSGYAATASSVTSITLDEFASSSDDVYEGMYITIRKSGRPPITTVIATYTGSTKIATIYPYILEAQVTTGASSYEVSKAVAVGSFVGGSDGSILTGVAQESGVLSIKLADTTGTYYCDDGTLDTDTTLRITKSGRFAIGLTNHWAYCDFSGTYTDGSYLITGSTVNSITISLAAGTPGAETVDVWVDPSPNPQLGIYVDNIITITGGMGEGQSRAITYYYGHQTGASAGSDNYCVVDRAWSVRPDATSTYKITPSGTNWLSSTAGVVLGGAAERGFWYSYYASEDTARTSTAKTIYVTHTTGAGDTVDNDFAPGTKVAFGGILGYSRPVIGIVKSMNIDDFEHCIITLYQPLPAAPSNGTLIYPCGNVLPTYWRELISSLLSH